MEYILVLLIVALLNGAIAYIDGLMEGIVPLTLYAEQYMSTLAGVDLFEALFDIVFGFGVSLIILKFLKKGFETYVLWSDGDADEEPIALLTNFSKAMAVAVCFPKMCIRDRYRRCPGRCGAEGGRRDCPPMPEPECDGPRQRRWCPG